MRSSTTATIRASSSTNPATRASAKSTCSEMKALRDQYDPHGGRAIGLARNARQPESPSTAARCSTSIRARACRCGRWNIRATKALRKYWDEFSPPFHKDGDGPLASRPGRQRLQPQSGFTRDRECRALVRLLARAPGHRQTR